MSKLNISIINNFLTNRNNVYEGYLTGHYKKQDPSIIFFPFINHVTPSLIGSELLTIQPMTQPNNDIYYVNNNFNNFNNLYNDERFKQMLYEFVMDYWNNENNLNN